MIWEAQFTADSAILGQTVLGGIRNQAEQAMGTSQKAAFFCGHCFILIQAPALASSQIPQTVS